MMWLFLTACLRSSPSPAGDLRTLEVVHNAADAEDVPVIVALHGLGDRPEAFVQLFDGYPHPARFVVVQAPTAYGPGFSWFPVTIPVKDRDPVQLATGIARAAKRVAGLLKRLEDEHGKEPVVTGFSQGGMLSYALAAHHAEHVAWAVPVSGALPKSLWPDAPGAPVRGLHGDADDVVLLGPTVAAVDHQRGLGADVALQVYPGVSHTIDRRMRADLFRWLHAIDQ